MKLHKNSKVKHSKSKEQLKKQMHGSIISLDFAPLSVNVELFCKDEKKLKNWKRESLVKDKVVIPLKSTTGGTRKHNKVLIKGGGNHYDWGPSYAEVKYVIPFELGFSMTLHKAQGRTLDSIILCLSKHPKKPITYQGLFVAMSRVKKGGDIRLLLKDKNHNNNNIQYINELRQPECIKDFFNCFRSPGEKFKPNIAANTCDKQLQKF